MPNIGVIGECMLELTKLPANQTQQQPNDSKIPAVLSFGGDTLNTAIYIARANLNVEYITAVGQDYLSNWLLQQWQNEQVGTQFVTRSSTKTVGMYFIQTNNGERTFTYWRNNSAAKSFFNNAQQFAKSIHNLFQCDWIYLSGITLALMSRSVKELFFEFLKEYRFKNGKVIFDSNYRTTLWKDNAEAQKYCQQMYQHTDVALPTFEDEVAIFNETKLETIIKRLQSYGIQEIALKKGAEGCYLYTNGQLQQVPSQIDRNAKVIDTTAAGDSFNGSYIASRMQQQSALQAANNGNVLAAKVICHQGAIIPLNS